MALVIKLSVSGAARISSDAAPSDAVYHPGQEKKTPCEAEYCKSCEGILNLARRPTDALRVVYYRFYNKSGAIPSKQSADSTDPAVGRINGDFVPPPLTAASVKRCLSKLEGLDDWKGSQLFSDITSKSPIGDGQYIATRGGGHVGSTPENPILFVESADSTFRERMRRIGQLLPFVESTEPSITSNRKMRVITAHSQSESCHYIDCCAHLIVSP